MVLKNSQIENRTAHTYNNATHHIQEKKLNYLHFSPRPANLRAVSSHPNNNWKTPSSEKKHNFVFFSQIVTAETFL